MHQPRPPQPSGSPLRSLQRTLGNLVHYRWMFLGAFGSLVLLTTANAITPQLFRWGIDEGIGKRDLHNIVVCAGLLVLVAIGRGLFSFGQNFWAESVSQGVAYDLRNMIFSKIQTLSFSYHDRAPTSQLLTRITSDIEQVRAFVGTTLLQLLSAVITLVTSAVILLVMNWQLALITLTSTPLAALLLVRFFTKNGYLFGLVQERLGNLNAVLQENLLGVRAVKAFVREPIEVDRYTEANTSLKAANLKTINALRDTFPLIFLLSNLVAMVVVGVGGEAVMSDRFSIGELVAFNSYLAFLIQPVLQVGLATAVIAQATASSNRVYEIVDAEVEIRDRPDAVALTHSKGRITFEDVHFRYPGADQEVLQGVSFEVKPGEFVAILGMTGSGKSTIMNLIPRFYDVTAGSVRIDGHDVRQLQLDSLRSHLGIVFQETTLFSGTIRENIAYAVPEASLEQIINAAKLAHIDDFIAGLPEGYDTVVGERGIGLSGGQKQRIAIARTLIKEHQILILDDSTSAVDAKTASLIQESLDHLMWQKSCTILVIAQRISTIRNADRILLVNQGKLVAQGTHQELMQTSPLYEWILESQVR
jgi:ATP-binding cassette, subfamily B, multidrug efflux pump